MEETNKTCIEVINHICENLGEDNDSPNCIALKEHLNNCPNCQSYLKSVKLTIELYKNYNVNISDEMHNKLTEILGLNNCE
jgi:predicted anti-sigma-YlaC factor YlaD